MFSSDIDWCSLGQNELCVLCTVELGLYMEYTYKLETTSYNCASECWKWLYLCRLLKRLVAAYPGLAINITVKAMGQDYLENCHGGVGGLHCGGSGCRKNSVLPVDDIAQFEILWSSTRKIPPISIVAHKE